MVALTLSLKSAHLDDTSISFPSSYAGPTPGEAATTWRGQTTAERSDDFLPAIVYLADAVGTQTETLAIRGLSVGVAIRGIVWSEIATGLAVGVGLAVVATPIMLWRWGASDITAVVILSVIGTCGVATGVAITLPRIIDRLGLDPAFGSGPLATVIQDLLSILIYLSIAAAVLR